MNDYAKELQLYNRAILSDHIAYKKSDMLIMHYYDAKKSDELTFLELYNMYRIISRYTNSRFPYDKERLDELGKNLRDLALLINADAVEILDKDDGYLYREAQKERNKKPDNPAAMYGKTPDYIKKSVSQYVSRSERVAVSVLEDEIDFFENHPKHLEYRATHMNMKYPFQRYLKDLITLDLEEAARGNRRFCPTRDYKEDFKLRAVSQTSRTISKSLILPSGTKKRIAEAYGVEENEVNLPSYLRELFYYYLYSEDPMIGIDKPFGVYEGEE